MNETLGDRLIHVLIDEKAKYTPNKAWASMPRNSSNLSDGFVDITFAALANAINRLSWFIKDQIGTSDRFETIFYVGPPDVRYHIVPIALNKVGLKGLFSAHRNSLSGHLDLMDKMSCKAILYGEGHESIAKELADAKSLPLIQIPSLSDLLDPSPVEHYTAFRKTMEESRWDPFVVLHTSGSTGLPKPVIITNEYLSRQDQLINVPKRERITVQELFRAPGRSFTTFPPFHVGGLVLLGPVLNVFGDTTLVWGPADKPLTADVATDIIKHGDIERGVFTTGLVDAMATDPDALKTLASLKYVGYAGGPLHPDLGALVAKSVRHLFSFFGSTETGMVVQYINDPEDWEWLDFSSPLNGMDMVPLSPGIYENIIKKDKALSAYQGSFGTFPHLSEWRTRDMWRPHPGKKGLYVHVGRLDDLIVYSNGSKWNPLGSEGILKMHEMISSAMIIGSGRKVPAAVVDLHHKYPLPTTHEEKERMLDALWPTVQEANKIAPTNGQILRHMVIFSRQEKPFLKTGKGTLMRAMTAELYKAELDHLYELHKAKFVPRSRNETKHATEPFASSFLLFSLGCMIKWPFWLLGYLITWFFPRRASKL